MLGMGGLCSILSYGPFVPCPSSLANLPITVYQLTSVREYKPQLTDQHRTSFLLLISDLMI